MNQFNEIYFCYILYSKKLDRFYIGSTVLLPEKRLVVHLSKHYGDSKYTSKANDWTLYFQIECCSIKEARYLEKYIKKMKSRKYIKDIKQYPEISHKLKKRFNDLDR